MWLGTRSASCSNHHSDIRVRIAPLSGMVVSRTKSNAEIRSLATMSRSPDARRYRSRTLPEWRWRRALDRGGVRDVQVGHAPTLSVVSRRSPAASSTTDRGSVSDLRSAAAGVVGDVPVVALVGVDVAGGRLVLRRTVTAQADVGVGVVDPRRQARGPGEVELVAGQRGCTVPPAWPVSVPPVISRLQPLAFLRVIAPSMVGWRMPSNDVQVELLRVAAAAGRRPADAGRRELRGGAGVAHGRRRCRRSRRVRPGRLPVRQPAFRGRRRTGVMVFPEMCSMSQPLPSTSGLKHERLRSGRRTKTVRPRCAGRTATLLHARHRAARSRHHSTSASTASSSPSKCPATEPSGSLRTQPATPSRAACCSVYQRNETPCTRPGHGDVDGLAHRSMMQPRCVATCPPGGCWRRDRGEGGAGARRRRRGATSPTRTGGGSSA